MFRTAFTFLLFAGLLVTSALAGQVYRAAGVVRAPLDNGRIVVAHDEIVGYMPAMTMAFDVAASAMMDAAALRAGDRVAFQLHVDEESTVADGFRVVGRGTAAPVTAAGPTAVRLRSGDLIPEFSLVDQDDRPVTRETLAGHATLVTFIFTRCPVPEYCPLVTRRFGELQRAIVADATLSRRVQLLSITLDPAYDRPAVLKAYGAAVGAKPGTWTFATGSEEQVGSFVKAFSVFRERNGVTLDHTLCTALVDSRGRIIDIWRGNTWNALEILGAIRSAP